MTQIVDDDEAEIEAEIQRQLDEISADNLEIEDVEDSLSSVDFSEKDDSIFPESIEEYLKYVQSRTETIQQEVNECDEILLKDNSDTENNENQFLAKRIKEALGDDCRDNPLEIRNKVLSEIEEAEEKEIQRRASHDNNMVVDIIRPAISDEIRLLEETAEKKLQELEERQSRKNQERTLMYEKMKIEENERLKKEQNRRKIRQKELEEAQNHLNESKKILQAKIEQEKIKEEEKLGCLERKFKKEMEELEKGKERERKALEIIKVQEEEYQRNKKNKAATLIQKCYRGHRVYRQHRETLQHKNEERLKRHEEELERKYQQEIARMEEEKKYIELQEKKRIEKERLRKEEEWKKEMEEKKRREEEVKRKEIEEQKRKEKEKEEEKKRKDEEKKKKQEEERKREMEEKKRREEDVKRKEIEEQKRKEEEEKKRKDEEKKKKQEEERKREMEEKRRKKEEEQKWKEEERKRKEEEKKRKEDEERKWKEEEEEKRKEEKKREEEQKRIQEENRRKEERKREVQKVELERKRKNEELKLKEEEKYQQYEQQDNLQSRTVIAPTAELNELRTKWLKNHVPWSALTTCQDREQPVAKSKARHRPRRPFSASKNLPQLTKEQILHASPPGTSLHKVIKVSLSSCPACNLHGLDSCPNLKSLNMTDCGLLAVEGLDECKDLQELRLQDNKIEFINIQDLNHLEDINLHNNNLTSVQGLIDCPQLKNLDLRSNRITRIGGLSACFKLQSLNMDNNQLITTKGLSNLKSLQSLSCADNHLPDVKEIDDCQLLQKLILTGNNLQKPPSLTSHVLLQELILDDNSISTLEPLVTSWLPSLRILSISQNSVCDIAPLNSCIMLQSLDIRHNLISDIEGLLPGLSACPEISELKIAGNPVNEEPQCRDAVISTLLLLQKLDDEVLPTKAPSSDWLYSPFVALCHKQLQENSDMKSRHEKQLSVIDNDTIDPLKVMARLKLKSQHYNELLEQAVAHLVQHESFDSQEQHTNRTETVLKAMRVGDDEVLTVQATSTCVEMKACEEKVELNKETRRAASERMLVEAAIKIQALWRGWHVRHIIDIQTKKWLAAATIQSAWRGHSCRSRFKPRTPQVSRARKALWDIRHDAAATTIQAFYRGYRVRRILAVALQNIKDDSDDDEFNYDEEVDLAAFDFDTGMLDDGWTPTDTPQLPSRGPVLPKAGQSGLIPSKPRRQAWRSADSPFEQDAPSTQHRVPAINVNRSPEQDVMSVTSGTQSHLTHRAEEMGNEWGLKNATTAELMWKRANRMKYNPARKRKMLDPTKRLALFKKLDEANKLKEVKPPPRRQPSRMEYFAAREALLQSGHTTPTSERETKAQMIYSWVHSQGVVHQDEESNYMGFNQDFNPQSQPKLRSTSLASKGSVSLPHLDPVQLSGRNIPLVSSPALIREQMVSKETNQRRSSSMSEATSDGSPSRSNEKSNSAGARMTNHGRERRRRHEGNNWQGER